MWQQIVHTKCSTWQSNADIKEILKDYGHEILLYAKNKIEEHQVREDYIEF